MGNELSGQDKERTVIRRDQLRELRNRIDFRHLFRRLGWPWKAREDGVILFACPECSESQTSVNRKTNLVPQLGNNHALKKSFFKVARRAS